MFGAENFCIKSCGMEDIQQAAKVNFKNFNFFIKKIYLCVFFFKLHESI